jgi:hypothetical protein
VGVTKKTFYQSHQINFLINPRDRIFETIRLNVHSRLRRVMRRTTLANFNFTDANLSSLLRLDADGKPPSLGWGKVPEHLRGRKGLTVMQRAVAIEREEQNKLELRT